jgi:hypothetical protein
MLDVPVGTYSYLIVFIYNIKVPLFSARHDKPPVAWSGKFDRECINRKLAAVVTIKFEQYGHQFHQNFLNNSKRTVQFRNAIWLRVRSEVFSF